MRNLIGFLTVLLLAAPAFAQNGPTLAPGLQPYPQSIFTTANGSGVMLGVGEVGTGFSWSSTHNLNFYTNGNFMGQAYGAGPNWIIGTSGTGNAVDNNAGQPWFQIFYQSATTQANSLGGFTFRNSAVQPWTYYCSQSNSNTAGTQAAVANGNQLCAIKAEGSDGTNFQAAGRELWTAGGAVSAGIVPGAWELDTANTSGTLTAAITVTDTQQVAIPGVTTGTNADFLCASSGHVILQQTSACTISSARFKRDIETFGEDALAEIAKFRTVTFRLKERDIPSKDVNFGRKQIGLTAENVAAVDPRLATYDQDGTTPRSYRQEAMIALLVKAVQQQQAEIVALQRRIGK